MTVDTKNGVTPDGSTTNVRLHRYLGYIMPNKFGQSEVGAEAQKRPNAGLRSGYALPAFNIDLL